jgi:hypothetical protein
VTWIAIGTLVITIIVAIVWSVVLTNQVMATVLETIPTR